MQTETKDLLEQATMERTTGSLWYAIKLYEQLIGDDKTPAADKLHCRQMLAVCLTQGGKWQDLPRAEHLYLELMQDLPQGSVEMGNMLRDYAACLEKQQRITEAIKHLRVSEKILEQNDDRPAVGQTMRFRGRLLMRLGDVRTATTLVGTAMGIAISQDNPFERLYATLDYAELESYCGNPKAARQQARKAWRLAKQYGQQRHRQRAFAIWALASFPKLLRLVRNAW